MVRLHAPEREHVDLIVASVAGGAAASDHDTQPPDLIRRSWARCLNSHRLDPARPGRPVVLTRTELGGFLEPMEEFIGIATAELRRLYAQVAGSDYVVILTDANGVAVDYLGQASFEQELKQAGLYLGSVWAEGAGGHQRRRNLHRNPRAADRPPSGAFPRTSYRIDLHRGTHLRPGRYVVGRARRFQHVGARRPPQPDAGPGTG
jgi:hypothetical protein